MGNATLSVQTDWPIQFFEGTGGGIGYWQITDGTPTDEDDFIVGGGGGLGIAPGAGDITRLVRGYTITRGRSSELDRVAAGEGGLNLYKPPAIFSPPKTSLYLLG